VLKEEIRRTIPKALYKLRIRGDKSQVARLALGGMILYNESILQQGTQQMQLIVVMQPMTVTSPYKCRVQFRILI